MKADGTPLCGTKSDHNDAQAGMVNGEKMWCVCDKPTSYQNAYKQRKLDPHCYTLNRVHHSVKKLCELQRTTFTKKQNPSNELYIHQSQSHKDLQGRDSYGSDVADPRRIIPTFTYGFEPRQCISADDILGSSVASLLARSQYTNGRNSRSSSRLSTKSHILSCLRQ